MTYIIHRLKATLKTLPTTLFTQSNDRSSCIVNLKVDKGSNKNRNSLWSKLLKLSFKLHCCCCVVKVHTVVLCISLKVISCGYCLKHDTAQK